MIELLVVIAILAILAGLLLPALARARVKAYALVCMNHTRQLMLANLMYQDDNQGKFPGAYHGGFLPDPNAPDRPWVSGWLDWTTSSDNTNTVLLLDPRYAVLAPYFARTKNLYRCPADRYVSPVQKARGWHERVRSISGNVLVGEGNAETGPVGHLYAHPTRASELTLPGPSLTWVYADEFPSSISDAAFFPPNSSTHFVDVPATHHGGAGGFAFADGHSEIHQWVGPTLKHLKIVPGTYTNNVGTRPGDPDLAWLAFHCPRKTTQSY